MLIKGNGPLITHNYIHKFQVCSSVFLKLEAPAWSVLCPTRPTESNMVITVKSKPLYVCTILIDRDADEIPVILYSLGKYVYYHGGLTQAQPNKKIVHVQKISYIIIIVILYNNIM